MAEQGFTRMQREAIWHAYDKKCFYTNELIKLTEFDIDHIIPESISSSEFNRIKSELKLPSDFDIHGYENLVPIKKILNSTKSDKILPNRALMFFLSFTEDKKKTILQYLDKFRQDFDMDKARSLIAKAMDCKDLSISDVVDFAEKMKHGFGAVNGSLIKEYPVLDGDLFSFDSLEQIRNAEFATAITLENSNGDEVVINTCADYIKYTKDNYYEKSNLDIKVGYKIRNVADLLGFLSQAHAPNKSLIHGLGLPDISELCASVFPDLSNEAKYKDKYRTYKGMYDAGDLKIISIGSKHIHVENDCMGQYLVEFCRGCFTDSKYEQILVFEGTYAIGGTFSYSRAFLLSKSRKNEKLHSV